jgi:hypothetical protein
MAAIAVGGTASLIGSPAFADQNVGRSYNTTIKGVAVHMALPYQWLNAGESWYFGKSRMLMRDDGELVIIQGTTVKLRTHTAGSGAVKLLFDFSDDLELVNAGGKVVWHTGTGFPSGKCDEDLSESVAIALQGDSNFVMYCGFDTGSGPLTGIEPIWATNTLA